MSPSRSVAAQAFLQIWSATEPPALRDVEWEQLLSVARSARLAARLAAHLEAKGWLGLAPPAAQTMFRNALKQSRRLHDEVLWEVDRIAHALSDLPGPVLLLKGAAYVAARLPCGRARLFNDVDILVPAAQLRTAELALFAAGWIATELDPYDERYYRDFMHELPPMRHVARLTSLDVHHTITPPTSRFAVDASSLIARAVPAAADARLLVLAPEDMVLHGVVHLMQDGDFSGGMRDLLDFHDLVHHFSADADFWPRLLARAKALSLEGPLDHVLVQAGRLFHLLPPPELRRPFAELAPKRLGHALTRWLLDTAIRPDHPALDTPLTGLARWLLYVRSHWLRMPWFQILPHLARKAWMRSRHRRPEMAAPAAGHRTEGHGGP